VKKKKGREEIIHLYLHGDRRNKEKKTKQKRLQVRHKKRVTKKDNKKAQGQYKYVQENVETKGQGFFVFLSCLRYTGGKKKGQSEG
jgi:hypothetical protein